MSDTNHMPYISHVSDGMSESKRNKAFEGCRRFFVYHKKDALRYLCVCLARSKSHALSVARKHGLKLERTAYAIEASGSSDVWN
jgi:hypothetical protein